MEPVEKASMEKNLLTKTVSNDHSCCMDRAVHLIASGVFCLDEMNRRLSTKYFSSFSLFVRFETIFSQIETFRRWDSIHGKCWPEH
mmetsp:Transcript_25407/g.54140  ORF Transcript_25407/g.54140 Transcript_25407/m.54140 type:complete len:86 (+) Transcript_25407:141-398(+)